MGVDATVLAVGVESGTIPVASDRLEKFTKSAQGAEGAAKSFGASVKEIATGVGLERFLEKIATSALESAHNILKMASALDDLSDATGSSVELLSQVANQAYISGVSIEQLSPMFQRLSMALSGIDDESKEAGKALAALGIASRDPASAFKELALRLDEYRDGAEKAALVQSILGRGAQQYLPLLKDMARDEQALATVTTEQARAAEEMEKMLRRISIESTTFKNAVLNTIVPAITELLTQFREGIKIAGSFMDALRLFGTINPFKSVTENLQAYREKLDEMKASRTQAMGEVYDGMVAAGQVYSDKDIADLEKKIRFLESIRDRDALSGAGGYADPRDAAAGRDTRPTAPKVGGKKPSAEDAQAVADFTMSLVKLDMAMMKVTGDDGGYEHLAKAEEEIRQAMADGKAFSDAEMHALLDKAFVVDELTIAYKHANEQAKEAAAVAKQQAEDEEKYKQTLNDAQDALYTNVQQLELEVEQLGMSNEQKQRAAALAMLDALNLDKEGEAYTSLAKRINDAYDAIDKYNQSVKDQEAAKKYAEEWNRAFEGIRDGLSDAFISGFGKGRSLGQELLNWLKQSFNNLVLRPIIQAVVAPMASSVTSMLYGGSGSGGVGAGAGGSGLSLGGIGQGMAGNYLQGQLGGSGLTLDGLYSSFAYSGVGSALGLSGASTVGAGSGALAGGLGAGAAGEAVGSLAGGASMTPMGTALGGALSAIASYIPYVAIALMIAQMFGAFDRGGPKAGGYAYTGSAGAYNRDEHWTPNDADEYLQSIVNKTTSSFNDMVKTLGGTSKGDFAIGYDKDPLGKANNRLEVQSWVNGKSAYQYWSGDDSLGRDDAKLQARMELEIKRSMVAALAATDIPAQIANVFKAMDASKMSSEEIDNLFKFANAMKVVLDSISGSVVDDAQKAWDDANMGAYDRLKAMGANVITVANNFDGTTESMTALAAATSEYRSAVVQTLVALKSISAQLKQMFQSTREGLETYGLGSEDQYAYWREKANSAMSEMMASTDPAKISQLSQNINTYMTNAFNSLPDDLKMALKPEILRYLNELDDLVTGPSGLLATIGKKIVDDTTDPFAAANKVLDTAAGKFDKAATTQLSAADKFDKAVDRLAGAVDTFAEQIPISIDLSGAATEMGGG